MRSSRWSEDGQLIRLVELTVLVRWVPELSVRCGTRVARPARVNHELEPSAWASACVQGEACPRGPTASSGKRPGRARGRVASSSMGCDTVGPTPLIEEREALTGVSPDRY
jgi:hypothetical protein